MLFDDDNLTGQPEADETAEAGEVELDTFNADAEDADEESAAGGAVKAPTRAFTVKSKKSGQPYTFKRIRSAKTGQKMFFTGRSGSLEERSRLYDDTAYRMEELRENLQECAKQGIHVTAATVEAVIPIDWLTLDKSWCRGKPIDFNHVAEILTKFSVNSLDLPRVTMRKVFDPATGQLLGVVFSLTDGVHRTVSLFELGDTHIRAMVTIVNEVADEAQIYSDCNYGRRAHARQDVVRALVTAKDPKIEEIRAIIGDYGFKIQDPDKPGKCVPPEINSVKTLISCFDRFGEMVLRRVMQLLNDARYPFWRLNPLALSGDFLTALCRYVDEFERPGYIHTDMTHHLFETMTPETIRAMGLTLTQTAQIADILGYQPFRNNVMPSSESGRIVQVLASMILSVRNFYKPKFRPANFHPKFKSALDVYYNKAISPADRADAINAIRRQLARVKLADGWFDGDSLLVR
jgi:hypothetical protein